MIPAGDLRRLKGADKADNEYLRESEGKLPSPHGPLIPSHVKPKASWRYLLDLMAILELLLSSLSKPRWIPPR